MQQRDIRAGQWAKPWFRSSDVDNMFDAMCGMQDAVLREHIRQKGQVIEEVQDTSRGHALVEGLAKTSLIVGMTPTELTLSTQLDSDQR